MRLGGRVGIATVAITLLIGMAAAACRSEEPRASPSASPPPIGWPTEGWSSASPESVGLDSTGLVRALVDLRPDYSPVHSVLIVRDGSMILDAYVYPYDVSISHDLASVTKSFVSTLIGIAATRGELDLDAPVVSFFPDREIANLDERKQRITVRHLLSMSSGLDCRDYPHEITQQEMRQSPDWVQFVLDLEVVHEPGTTFSYCSPGMHLLSAILQQATGMTALEFAREHLFGPLGIDDVYWPADPQGVTHGWGDLALAPRDAAKLGFLYLHRGEWDGRQILSPEWVAEATSPQADTGEPDDYGYGWWVSEPDDEITLFRADGNLGQRILVVPSRDLVVVTTGGGFSPDALFSSLAPMVMEEPDPLPPDAAGADELAALVTELAAGPDPDPVQARPDAASAVSGRTYTFRPNRLGARSLQLDFGDPVEVVLTLDIASEAAPRVDRVGLDGVFRPSLEGRPIVARGHWEGPRTFVVECDEGPGFHEYELRLRFDGRTVRLQVDGVNVGIGEAPEEVPGPA